VVHLVNDHPAKYFDPDSPLKAIMLKHAELGAEVAARLAAYKSVYDRASSSASWYQHRKCEPFKAYLECEPDIKYSCSDCKKLLTGEAWYDHKME